MSDSSVLANAHASGPRSELAVPAVNPYFRACPVYLVKNGADKAYTGSSFVARAQDGNHFLVIPAHLAACHEELENTQEWGRVIYVRPAPTSTCVSVELFDESSKPQFISAVFDQEIDDVIAIRIPNEEFSNDGKFSNVNMVDLSGDPPRCCEPGEETVYSGFPNVFDKWPPPYAISAFCKVQDKYRCVLDRDFGADGGFSGSAAFTMNSDDTFVGMIVGHHGRTMTLVPADYIWKFVNGRLRPEDKLPYFIHASTLWWV